MGWSPQAKISKAALFVLLDATAGDAVGFAVELHCYAAERRIYRNTYKLNKTCGSGVGVDNATRGRDLIGVRRNNRFGLDELIDRKSRLFGTRRKNVADIQHSQIGSIEAFHDSLHVAHLPRVAGQIEAKAVREHQHVTTRQSRRMAKMVRCQLGLQRIVQKLTWKLVAMKGCDQCDLNPFRRSGISYGSLRAVANVSCAGLAQRQEQFVGGPGGGTTAYRDSQDALDFAVKERRQFRRDDNSGMLGGCDF